MVVPDIKITQNKPAPVFLHCLCVISHFIAGCLCSTNQEQEIDICITSVTLCRLKVLLLWPSDYRCRSEYAKSMRLHWFIYTILTLFQKCDNIMDATSTFFTWHKFISLIQVYKFQITSACCYEIRPKKNVVLLSHSIGPTSPAPPGPGGGGRAVPFWRRRVCKGQKTPFFSIAGTHRPHIFFTVAWAHTQRPIFLHLICHSKPHDLKSWHVKKFTLVILQSSIQKTFALTRWPHIFLYFSLTECQKSCSHPMTPHFLSLCSHWMPQPVWAWPLHPYPFHIWLPPPPGPTSSCIIHTSIHQVFMHHSQKAQGAYRNGKTINMHKIYT